MPRNYRSVADRQKSLEPVPARANFTLAGARAMYSGIGGKEFHCTISGYCRTQIFEFPGTDLQADGDEPHHEIYASPSIRAGVTSNLADYFVKSKSSPHYAISPSLRHAVTETDEKIKRQQGGRLSAFLVIQESNPLAPVVMDKGECHILDEVVMQDGEKIPMLVGGREGEEFVAAWATIDGAWPELPNNQQMVNLILAAVRAAQQSSDPIRKHLDQDGLVTDEVRYVVMMRPTMSARASAVTPMDAPTFKGRISEIRNAITAMEQDIGSPHMALLVNSMYSDEHKDDAFQRLHYLQLWQSLSEAARPSLGYQGDIRRDKAVLAGKKTLRELTGYRDDIAHWWTDTIDENYLVALRSTINELIRRKYF